MEEVIIIGTGCAGWTAAIYTGRANLAPLVLAGGQPGGQLTTTTEVENFPGFPEGIDGAQLMFNMQQQATKFGARVDFKTVESVTKRDDGTFGVDTGSETLEARTVIVATGARANYLGLPSEDAYKNKGVSACAVCDGALPIFCGKPLAVIGGGDSAVEEATYLANLKDAATIYMVHRRDQLRASKIMQQRALEHPKIELVWNHVVEEVLGDGHLVTGVRLKSTVDASTRTLEVGGMFVAIGHTPNTDFLKGKLEMNEKGYIKWGEPFRTRTSVAGVFAAGDVADDCYRQAVTSAGTGCMAALDAERYLAEQNF